MKSTMRIALLILVPVIFLAGIRIRTNLKDRHPGFQADMHVPVGEPVSLKAGFSAVRITPAVPDRWTDVNGDARYHRKDGDTFTDGNDNGKFDAVWMAGFSNAKPANGIHDDLWARTMILDDGKTRLAFVALDVIGLPNDHIIDIRIRIPSEAGITYTLVSSTHPSLTITDPFTGDKFTKPSFEKAEAQGKQLSLLILRSIQNPKEIIDTASISLDVRTLTLPIKNAMFRLAASLGILDRGTKGWMKTRTELAIIRIGPVSILTIPGEIYPELVNGGTETSDGRDFPVDSVEKPSIREMMPGKYKFVLGLTNDEIGYIIPKTQWDVRPPFVYNLKKAQYGEENSLGPETAPILHKHLKELLGNTEKINCSELNRSVDGENVIK